MPTCSRMCRWFVLFLLCCIAIKFAWKQSLFLWQGTDFSKHSSGWFSERSGDPLSNAAFVGLGTYAEGGWSNMRGNASNSKVIFLSCKAAAFPRSFGSWYQLAVMELWMLSGSYGSWTCREGPDKSKMHTFELCLSWLYGAGLTYF